MLESTDEISDFSNERSLVCPQCQSVIFVPKANMMDFSLMGRPETAEKEGSNLENAEPTIKDKSPLQRKNKAETVKPSPQSQKKKLLEENGARTEGGKSDSVRTSGKKEKQTKIISFTDSRKPVQDEENSVQEKMSDKCIFQCTICQPFRRFNEVEEFKSHLNKDHKTRCGHYIYQFISLCFL